MMKQKEWIFGFHAIEAALDEGEILQVVIDKTRRDKRMNELLEKAYAKSVVVNYGDGRLLDETADDVRHQGIMAEVLVRAPENEDFIYNLLESIDHPPFLLILDEVQDPHNVGACLRTAEAFGIDAVIVPKDNSCGLTPIVRKVSSGSSERMPFVEVTNISRFLEAIKAQGIWTYGLAGGGEGTVYSTDFRGPVAIVMGSEGKGLRRLTEKQCDFIVKIPMEGKIESLNVSVATAVTLGEAYRQRQGL